ncbi:MAG: hypothetical protein K9K88_11860 [Desulfobacterales bacterium]|nr:hypothetical protein [Desulfobacterales bacterium]
MKLRRYHLVIPDERSEDKPAPDPDPGESRKFKNLLDPGSPLRCGRDDGLGSFTFDQTDRLAVSSGAHMKILAQPSSLMVSKKGRISLFRHSRESGNPVFPDTYKN